MITDRTFNVRSAVPLINLERHDGGGPSEQHESAFMSCPMVLTFFVTRQVLLRVLVVLTLSFFAVLIITNLRVRL